MTSATLSLMPITPVHMGPALAAKAVAPRYFSFHGLRHHAGSDRPRGGLLSACGLSPVPPLAAHLSSGQQWLRCLRSSSAGRCWNARSELWNRLVRADRESFLWIEPRVPLVAAVSGALIGGYSHVLLDSFLYSDMHPISPMSDGNPVLNVLSTLEVYALCLALGLLGAIALAVRWLWGRLRGA